MASGPTILKGKDIAEYVALDDILAASDVMFLYCNLTSENEKFINEAAIGKMKDIAILINDSSGNYSTSRQ